MCEIMTGKSEFFSEVHKFKTHKRTEGDGMENNDIRPFNSVAEGLEKESSHKSVCTEQIKFPVKRFPGKTVNLAPKIELNNLKSTSFNVKFSREPKFVPYEPYKAATSPIIKNMNEDNRKFKNADTDVQNLMNTEKLRISPDVVPEVNTFIKKENVWEEEKKAMLDELDKLKKKNSKLENQVKFQAQINGEIKKLLIAAVGEDMETRVHSLTEDKIHLAKQLLNTAKTLSTHQEQIEWLVGQCEVWRSKFLASSMLVEDLAKYKAKLCQRVSNCENALRYLLKDNDKLRQHESQTFINLTTLHEKFDLNTITEDTEMRVTSSNVINLCASNRQLSELLIVQLLHENINKKKIDFDTLNSMTSAEKNAGEILSQPLVSFECSEIACSAVMTGAALALSSTAPHCCHCTGTVTTI